MTFVNFTVVSQGARLVRHAALPRVIGLLRSSSPAVRAAAVSAIGWVAGEGNITRTRACILY
jgi:HEAT repeat protein